MERSQSDRRSFLKTNLALGLGALAADIAPTGSTAMAQGTRSMYISNPLAVYKTCLGGNFPDVEPVEVELRDTRPMDGYRIESIVYDSPVEGRIPALVLVPDHVTEDRPAPAVAVWHQHNGEYHLGKSEPAGLAGNPMHHTGAALAREGYVVLCPDALCFEERQDPTAKLQGGNYERFEFLRQIVRGRSMAWVNIVEMRRAIDVLCARPDVCPDRIGCYGHSMGSTHAWLVGPVEPRLKCVVGNCCLPTYEAIEEDHLLHCFPNFVPGWSNHGDTPDIAALIAPRALHLNLGANDGGSPIASALRGVQRIAESYAAAGASENFTYYVDPEAGHVLSDEMWARVKAVLARHLTP